jgi:hypothetical protein
VEGEASVLVIRPIPERGFFWPYGGHYVSLYYLRNLMEVYNFILSMWFQNHVEYHPWSGALLK